MDPRTTEMRAVRFFAALFAVASGLFAQTTVLNIDPAADAKEQQELQQAVGEAGSSQIDLIRALELHLKKYPQSRQIGEVDKALAKAAMETNDNARIILYGERVLGRETPPDLQNDLTTLLDRVIRALVDKPDAEKAKRAIVYSERYQADIAQARAKIAPPGHLTPVQWSEELNKAGARALALQARATGYTGDAESAVKIAKRSWDVHPTGEAAREAAYWLSKLDRSEEAIERYADAFTIEDPRNTELDRSHDRAALGAIYTKLHGNEKGLGDLILAAYDRVAHLEADWKAALKAKDPNSVATTLTDFILPPVDKTAQPLTISSLKGKTVVMDFWATWCAPCRAQQPLIEKVKAQFAADPNVLFVPVDSDDDPSPVGQFVKEQGWANAGYFEAGLARVLNVASIPTVLIIGPDGQVSSRMIGFIPDRFEQMLTERVEEARKSR
jgi:thiol-disulfide isomerase/thioredoxin